MNISKCVDEVKIGNHLNLCFDVSQNYLDVYTEYEKDGIRYTLEDRFLNRTSKIIENFMSYEKLCNDLGFDGFPLCMVFHAFGVVFLVVFVVDQRIVERIYVTGSFPGFRMHKDGRIDTYDIIMHLHHGLPPVFFEVVLQ